MNGLCAVVPPSRGKRSRVAVNVFVMAIGVQMLLTVRSTATAGASEYFCRNGGQPAMHLSPLQGGFSLLEQLHSETPTFRLPNNAGCIVAPLGVAVRDVENVTYQFGSVTPSVIAPSADVLAGGFNLSFAANQSLQMQPGNIILPAKEAMSYVLECQCPATSTVLVQDAAPVVIPATTLQRIQASEKQPYIAEQPLRLWGGPDVENQSSVNGAALAVALPTSQTAALPSSNVLNAQIASRNLALPRKSAVGDAILMPARQDELSNQSTNFDSAGSASVWAPLSAVGWASTAFAHTMMAISHGVSLMVVLKVACMASNLVFQVSPLPQVQAWLQSCSTGEVDAAPFVAIGVCAWQWCLYGLYAWRVTGREGFLILVHSNCVGAILGIYYTVSFWQNCKNVSARYGCVKYLRGALILLLAQIFAMLTLPIESSLKLSGLTASLCSLLSGVSTLLTVPAVLRTGSSASIPGEIVVAGLLTSSLWFACGIVLHDPCILVPNGVSIIVASFCVALKLWYPAKRKRTDLEDPIGEKSLPPTALSAADGKAFLVRRGAGADNSETASADNSEANCAGTGGSW